MTYLFIFSAGVVVGIACMGFAAMKALDVKDSAIKRLGIENQKLKRGWRENEG
jgi:hypothetical protein